MFQSPDVGTVVDVCRTNGVLTSVSATNSFVSRHKRVKRCASVATTVLPGQQDALDAVELAAHKRVGRLAVRRVHFPFGRVLEEIRVVQSGTANYADLFDKRDNVISENVIAVSS